MNEFMIRWGTQDLIAAQEVINENQYRLPEAFTREDLIIDVGAHIGCFALACLQRGAGRVICFEPERLNFDMLRRNMSPFKARASCHHKAVWRSNNWITVAKAKDGLTAMHHTLCGPGDWHSVDNVATTRLDTILSEFQKVRLLKLDCEGSEKPILDACNSLANVEEVIGEIHYAMPAPGEDAPTDVWLRAQLSELGFHYVEIVPSKIDPHLTAMFWAKRK
jgi:FkbM family methyltransferase